MKRSETKQIVLVRRGGGPRLKWAYLLYRPILVPGSSVLWASGPSISPNGRSTDAIMSREGAEKWVESAVGGEEAGGGGFMHAHSMVKDGHLQVYPDNSRRVHV